MRNPIVDEVQEIRQRLIKKHGGIEGYVKHLQEFQKTLPADLMVTKPLIKTKKKSIKTNTVKKTTKSKTKSIKPVTAKRSAKRRAL